MDRPGGIDPTMSPAPDPAASPQVVPTRSVATSVTVGPDGAFYVSQLTGFSFPVGGASIFRVVPGADPTVDATGLTNVMGLGGVTVSPDGTVYVANGSVMPGGGALSWKP